MIEQLINTMQRNQLMSMMYVYKTGAITKSRIKVIKTKHFVSRGKQSVPLLLSRLYTLGSFGLVLNSKE
ncbi:hypothetical protein [Lysinibacillus sp. NPDC093216]|uniref:hypothetical protein n=1 Tax=Lysinibacillus sp. NPDC093216 TaxID=3390576 RepID=UPI003D033D58